MHTLDIRKSVAFVSFTGDVDTVLATYNKAKDSTLFIEKARKSWDSIQFSYCTFTIIDIHPCFTFSFIQQSGVKRLEITISSQQMPFL